VQSANPAGVRRQGAAGGSPAAKLQDSAGGPVRRPALQQLFQFGLGRSLLGISQNVPVEAYVPVIMFAIVFGLSMDYEVFLLSRVKEAWDRTRDHHEAVAADLASTGGRL
jgi:MMPL family